MSREKKEQLNDYFEMTLISVGVIAVMGIYYLML